MGERILIYCGGRLGPWALEERKEKDLLVGADRGALFLLHNGIRPDFALGDFDSVSEQEKAWIREQSGSFIDYDPINKDKTDSELSFDWAVSRQPKEILLIGALGTRLDHSLGNVYLLSKALTAGISCSLVDEFNRVQLISPKYPVRVLQDRFDYVSLLPFSERVTGITLTGFQYPLYKAALAIGDSLGISNRLSASYGTVEIETGRLLVIASKD